jgi:predicted GNAT family acetyltransferase
MTVFIPNEQGKITKVEMAKLAPRSALATREPMFSKEQMIDIIRTLASSRLAGRGFGSAGLEKAAEFIAQEFRDAGLVPGGDREGSWYQTWEDTGGDPPVTAVMKNVIGVIPGTKPERNKGSVVIGAHYDHLGLGWPDSRDKKIGAVHPGADDNASGVAVLIELARALAKGPKPDRTIVFVAFTGEEAGKRGSKYYVLNEKRWPVNYCIGMVNLDTVGRLGKKKLLVLGAGSAREWVHIFRGAGFVTGVEIDAVSEELDSSDQKSFQEAGVPAVQLFSGPNLDYHRTTDTSDKIDPDGLVKVADVTKEVVDYLAKRDVPLSPAGAPPAATGTPAGTERKVSLGTIPDFGYSGKGFRLSGVVPGSPAEAAGLKEGDVIIAVNAKPVEGLKDFSDILKTLQPGDKVTVNAVRANKEMTVEAVVAGR